MGESSPSRVPDAQQPLNAELTDRLLTLGDANSDDAERWRSLAARYLHAATHDVLTGLPNRIVLLKRLTQELKRDASGAAVAVLFVDLDHFKLVNDSLGHDAGDEVLREMALRIGNCLGSADMVSRFGGDELVILHPHAISGSESALGSRILACMAQPMRVAGREVVLSASVGVALCAAGKKSAEQLLREADTALYSAKSRGRGRVEHFNEELHTRVEKRVQIESDLRVALRESQLFVLYQPQVNLKNGRVVGVEALVRWRHPRHGIVMPVEFISIAEECGLIQGLGRFVLRQSCQQLAEWARLSPGRALTMTVNVSPRQIDEPGFVAELAQLLGETGIRPDALCLELTESAVIGEARDTAQILRQITQMGVFVSIDDFGTEHSSLARLRSMPAEVLKIDRCFVDGLSSEPGDTAVVSSILSLAYAMGKHAIAEGVEHAEQAIALRRLGCEVAQGYLFSPPVEASQILPMLDGCLWQPHPVVSLRAAAAETVNLARRGHRYFIDEFLDHIGAPMGSRSAGPP